LGWKRAGPAGSGLQQSNFWEVRTEAIEVLEVRGQYAVAAARGGRHDNRIDDGRAFHYRDGFARDTR
jgi:hypothetical protein